MASTGYTYTYIHAPTTNHRPTAHLSSFHIVHDLL